MPDQEEAGMLMLSVCKYVNVSLAGSGYGGGGEGREGVQWAVGFKQGTSKGGDSSP